MFPTLLSCGLLVSRPTVVRYTDEMTRYSPFPAPAVRTVEVLPNGRLPPATTIPALQAVLQSLREKNDPKAADLIQGLEKMIEQEQAAQKKAAPK